MSKTPLLTFVDADVLIAASRMTDRLSAYAAAALADTSRSFAASAYVRLETLPKPDFHRNDGQLKFLEFYFSRVAAWAASSVELSQRAEQRARRHGLSAMDALHLEAAVTLGAKEFLTAERRTSPLFRETSIRVVTIRPVMLG